MTILWLILIPLVGGAAAWVAALWSARASRFVSLAALACDAVLALGVWFGADTAQGRWLVEFRHAWIPQIGTQFIFAMDGLSLLMILLTVFLGIVSVMISWTEVRERVGFFHFNLLWVLAGIVGVFTALDLFLFYCFWELMLIPMYFLIAIWGHENRIYAAIKFFLFTQLSGLLMLLAILAFYFIHGQATGRYTFDYAQWLGTSFPSGVGLLLMLGFLAAFAVKLPAVPFHTWLPDAHTEAPTAGSVVLAGLLLKTGAYGMIRFAIPLFPEAAMDFAPIAMTLGVIGIIYGAVLAFAQTDLKRLVAYTSVSHMGFVLLGVFAWNELALQGVVMQMLAHGIATGALFIVAGALQERIHTRDLSRMGGLWSVAPRLGGVAMVFALASLGLPGFGNFVAEFLTLLGSWRVAPVLTVLATTGLIASAVYSLRIMQRAFHGPATSEFKFRDLGVREMTAMGALIVAIVWIGIYPQPVLDTARPALDALRLEQVVPLTAAQPVGSTISEDSWTRDFRLYFPARVLRPSLSADLLALLPAIVLSCAAVLAMLLIAWRRNHAATVFLTTAGLALSIAAVPVALPLAPRAIASLLVVDGFALFYFVLIALAALAVALFSSGYLCRFAGRREEFYVLLLLATVGAALLAASDHFVSFFVALEILTVSLYGLLAFARDRDRSIEAGLKYLILAAVSTGFLLFGMALVYLRTGSLGFPALANHIAQGASGDLLLLGGLGMIVVGFGFKLALVPFHMWTADVYEGAPAPATAFIATVSKGGAFAVLLRVFARLSDAPLPGTLFTIFACIAVASMFLGNLLALRQTNVKRLLAYSSIAHLGYLLVAFLASGPLGPMAATYYLAAYFITTLGAFGVVGVLSSAERDADLIEDYRGLAWRRPWLATVFIAMLFSLAGIPLTAGFVGKFIVLSAGVQSSLWMLAFVLVVNSAIGLYYYLRVVVAMVAPPETADPSDAGPGPHMGTLLGGLSLAVLTLLLVWFGVYPEPLLSLIRAAVALL
ncbi:NADH-quinone oxidoreductase subunit M [Candidatus Sumerlaeota bacterium]|nr:NADH-quinone oxidoreductase subunit M [Candidatus Sumerlaeota bacterium]